MMNRTIWFFIILSSLFTLSRQSNRFLWKLKDWTPCSKTCGKGTSQSVFGCYDIIRETYVKDDNCRDLLEIRHQKPCQTSIQCEDESSTTEPEGFWHESGFGECSATCGRAIKSRLVVCIGFSGLKVLEDSKCSKDTRPTDYILCDIDDCPVIADWAIGAWSTCSEECNGVETRKVLCKRDNGKQALDHHCQEIRPKPPMLKACGGPCIKWVPGKWGKCRYNARVKRCDEAKQTRCVICLDKRTFQESDECPLENKPVTKRSCDHNSC